MEKAEAGATKKPAIWDCGSSLYDSFELESLKRQLDSVIASRTYSMPRLSDPAASPPPPPKKLPRKPSKASRSVHSLLRTVFRVGAAPAAPPAPPPPGCMQVGRGHRGVHHHGGAVEAMPGPTGNKGGAGQADQPGGPSVRRTASERYKGVPVVSRISCH